MEKKSFDLPTMFGDHHVLEVRRILLETPGVVDVYASSAFQVVEVTYDPAVINDLQLAIKLDEAGYLGEWTPVTEISIPAIKKTGDGAAFRHTETYTQTRQVISFAQNVGFSGRPLWPCPGMGVIKPIDEEN
jgi:copper chaperone CopZ